MMTDTPTVVVTEFDELLDRVRWCATEDLRFGIAEPDPLFDLPPYLACPECAQIFPLSPDYPRAGPELIEHLEDRHDYIYDAALAIVEGQLEGA
jgi:hypothetical protein